MTESKKILVHEFATPVEASLFKIEDYISFDHRQDCCEHVYIDFEHVEDQRQELNSLLKITKFEIATAPDDGVILNLFNGEKDEFAEKRVSIFLPCRNDQNGYYNDNLTLIVTVDGGKTEFDLQELGAVKNDEY